MRFSYCINIVTFITLFPFLICWYSNVSVSYFVTLLLVVYFCLSVLLLSVLFYYSCCTQHPNDKRIFLRMNKVLSYILLWSFLVGRFLRNAWNKEPVVTVACGLGAMGQWNYFKNTLHVQEYPDPPESSAPLKCTCCSYRCSATCTQLLRSQKFIA